MYLQLTEHHHLDLIKKIELFRDGELEEPPKILRQLAKLPAMLSVLADRGFDGDNLLYPNFNKVIIPEFMDSEKKTFHYGTTKT